MAELNRHAVSFRHGVEEFFEKPDITKRKMGWQLQERNTQAISEPEHRLAKELRDVSDIPQFTNMRDFLIHFRAEKKSRRCCVGPGVNGLIVGNAIEGRVDF